MLTKKQIKIINVVNAVMKRKRGIKMEDNIELVIKLPKGIYVASQMLNVKPDDVVQIPLEVIANGTPLSKRHGDLIDVSTLNRKDVNCANVPMNFIDTAPIIIEADKTESEGKK